MMLTDIKQKRSTRIHNLELKHQDAVHKTTLVTRDEEARRLKLQTVVLRDQKAALEDKLSEKDENIKRLVARCRQFESEVEAGKEAMRKQSVQMKTQTRDFVHLQVCSPCHTALGILLSRCGRFALLLPGVPRLASPDRYPY